MRPAAAQAGLAEIAPGSWDELLEQLGRADVYLLRDYVEGACLLEPGRPAFLHHGNRAGDVVFACIVRELPDGSGRDVTTPYGYGGPVPLGERPPVGRFYAQYERWCAENRVLTTFIRFHPLLANHRLAPPAVRVEAIGQTIGWRLDASDELLASMHSKHRNVVRKARSAGVTVRVRRADDLGDFVELYEETMRRQGASPFYFFPRGYWEHLSTRLRDRLVRFDALLAGELAASALCLDAKPWLHYHLGATSERARSTGAGNLVLYEAAEWAKARDFTRFHLGGGVGGGRDSLFEFKRRFDPGGECEACIGKAVHDPERYRALAGEDGGLEGFFPAYRRAS